MEDNKPISDTKKETEKKVEEKPHPDNKFPEIQEVKSDIEMAEVDTTKKPLVRKSSVIIKIDDNISKIDDEIEIKKDDNVIATVDLEGKVKNVGDINGLVNFILAKSKDEIPATLRKISPKLQRKPSIIHENDRYEPTDIPDDENKKFKELPKFTRHNTYKESELNYEPAHAWNDIIINTYKKLHAETFSLTPDLTDEEHRAKTIPRRILMVRPTLFMTNKETLEDNKSIKTEIEGMEKVALAEFNEMVDNLQDKDVEVITYDQCDLKAPDSIFPNNWFSTHKNENFPEGLFILYPMKAKDRRLERNPEIIEFLRKDYKEFLDLTYLENENEFIESTGVLIFDNYLRKIYVNISTRATKNAVNIFIQNFNKISKNPYKLITFSATDENDFKIYHSNVMMSILEKHAVICLDTIKNEIERKNVENELSERRELVNVSFNEMKNFCCNILSVKNKRNDTVLSLSKNAIAGFTKEHLATLEKAYILCVNKIDVIEEGGGGSCRCMMAELFGF